MVVVLSTIHWQGHARTTCVSLRRCGRRGLMVYARRGGLLRLQAACSTSRTSRRTSQRTSRRKSRFLRNQNRRMLRVFRIHILRLQVAYCTCPRTYPRTSRRISRLLECQPLRHTSWTIQRTSPRTSRRTSRLLRIRVLRHPLAPPTVCRASRRTPRCTSRRTRRLTYRRTSLILRTCLRRPPGTPTSHSWLLKPTLPGPCPFPAPHCGYLRRPRI